ncbi:hypothetical protein [Nocardioides hwasunensis]|uniref:BatC protein n=1 Tax=Nocardioides hwasunensis TaxID=397258 RepID=A0ABR8MI05_9ACTN|nr:hypothetical protein [Nocardioides hwasunensis]MBD3915699.1 hypothetical protein [Nocardioides hwasunensis]
MTTSDQQQSPHDDPQTHLDTDPANNPDLQDDPAHETDDEGWGSEGGATPDGPATDS